MEHNLFTDGFNNFPHVSSHRAGCRTTNMQSQRASSHLMPGVSSMLTFHPQRALGSIHSYAFTEQDHRHIGQISAVVLQNKSIRIASTSRQTGSRVSEENKIHLVDERRIRKKG